jgi:hypothetical protein
MISRRQYLYHSILNAIVLALAFALLMALLLTSCSGPEGVEQPDSSAAARTVHATGVHLAGREQ